MALELNAKVAWRRLRAEALWGSEKFKRWVMATFEEIRSVLTKQPQPECLKLTPFDLVEANAEAAVVRVRFAPQPAFGNHFGDIQSGFAAAMLDVPISAAVFVKVGQWLPTVAGAVR